MRKNRKRKSSHDSVSAQKGVAPAHLVVCGLLGLFLGIYLNWYGLPALLLGGCLLIGGGILWISNRGNSQGPGRSERRKQFREAAAGLYVILVFAGLDLLFGALLSPRVIGIQHPYYHHGLRPNASNEEKDLNTGWHYQVHTNSLTFRDASHRQVPRKTDKHRLLFIGDSFTEGLGCDFEDTFVGRIARRFDSPKVEVLNAGVNSYSPKIYYLKTKYLLEQVGLQFHELYVFIDISDIQDEVLNESFQPRESLDWHTRLDRMLFYHSLVYSRVVRPPLLSFRMQAEIVRAFQNSPGGRLRNIDLNNWNDFSDKFGLPSFIYFSLYKDLYKDRAKWTYDPRIFEKWGERGLRLATENMQRLVALCRRHQIRLTVAVYPWPEQILHDRVTSKQAVFWGNFCRKRRVRFINLFPNFFNYKGESPKEIVAELFFPRDMHWNQKGHKLVADSIEL